MKTEITILALWLIAIVATLIIVKDASRFTYLAPVYAICMIGSVVTVRRLRRETMNRNQSEEEVG